MILQRRKRARHWDERCKASILPSSLVASTRQQFVRSRPDDWNCVALYTGMWSETINYFLRNGSHHPRIQAYEQEMRLRVQEGVLRNIANLECLMRSLPENLVLWRGLNLSHMPDLQPGFVDPAFVSTAHNREVAEKFARFEGGYDVAGGKANDKPALLKMMVRAGHPAIAIGATPSGHMRPEAEVLLERGSCYQLVDRYEEDKITVLVCTVSDTASAPALHSVDYALAH